MRLGIRISVLPIASESPDAVDAAQKVGSVSKRKICLSVGLHHCRCGHGATLDT